MSKRLIFLLFIFNIAYNAIAMDTFEGIETADKEETKLNYNIKGILNNNSNCFMSAVLQCIMQNKEWVTKVLNSSANNYLKKLLNNLIDPKENFLNIEDLYEYMVREYFSGNYWQHQDAHQFLINFFNEFTTDCDDFQNVECTINKCINCGNLTKNYSPFYTLSLSINNHTNQTNIEDLLEEHFNLEYSNFNCHCGHNTCQKQLKFHNLPKYLILDIKRFNFDHNFLTNTKVNLPVHIKELLTLKSEYFENQNSNPVYKLQGLVEHHSFLNEDTNAGHYTACVNYDNKWYKCDDLTIKAINDITDNTSSYILFYKLEPKIKSNFVCNFCNKDCKYKKVLSNHIDRFHYYEQRNMNFQPDFQDQYMQDNSSTQSTNFVDSQVTYATDVYEDYKAESNSFSSENNIQNLTSLSSNDKEIDVDPQNDSLYEQNFSGYKSSNFVLHSPVLNKIKYNKNIFEDISGNEQQSNFVCDICKKNYHDKKALYQHRLIHPKPGKSYICNFIDSNGQPCNEDCGNPAALRDHKKKHPKPGKTYICNFIYSNEKLCNKDCGHEVALKDHQRNHPKPGKSYICNFVDSNGTPCNKDCGHEIGLRDHYNKHRKQEKSFIYKEYPIIKSIFVCNFCNKDCKYKKVLSNHIARFHSNENCQTISEQMNFDQQNDCKDQDQYTQNYSTPQPQLILF